MDVDPREFDAVVQEARVPVLVDFWAPWCPPCRAVGPQVEKAARNLRGRAIVLKVDTEKYPGLAARYGVEGIPNFLVVREGRPVFQQPGAVGAETLEAWAIRAGA